MSTKPEIPTEHITWLKYCYKKFQKNEQVNERVALIELWNDLPKGFLPNEIDTEYYRNEKITLTGIWIIDKNSSIFKECDFIIKELINFIKSNPEQEKIIISDLPSAVSIDIQDISKVLRILYDYGFLSGLSSQESIVNEVSISIQSLNAFKNFKNISAKIKTRLYEREKQKTNSVNRRLIRKELQGGLLYDTTNEDESIAVEKNTAFIIMQINPENAGLEDILNTIKSVAKNFGIDALRADEIQHEDKITDVILNKIKTSEFIIADLTGERPNVYYEVGYAHSEGKRPILVREKGAKLHFDLSIHNVPEYRNNKQLENILIKKFQNITGSLPKIYSQKPE